MSTRRIASIALAALAAGACAKTQPGPTAKVPAPKIETAATPAPVAVPEIALPQSVPVEGVGVLEQSAAERPGPVVQDVSPALALPPSVNIGSLDPQPAPLPVASVPAIPSQPAPAPIPQPVYVETSPNLTTSLRTRRAMRPIYDDPIDVAAAPPSALPPFGDIAAHKGAYRGSETRSANAPPPRVRSVSSPAFGAKLAEAAKARLNPAIRYDARYVKIGYPWGDVPADTGVCSDVVIRTYRALGVDLQSLLHEDMRRAFSAYPSRKIYGLKKADPNIDHRRVVNLEAFFERVGASLPVTNDPGNYLPGDIVTWRLSGSEPHTGVVIDRRDPRTGNPLIVHNLGAGVRAEDILFLSPPVGHYRFAPDRQSRMASLALKR